MRDSYLSIYICRYIYTRLAFVQRGDIQAGDDTHIIYMYILDGTTRSLSFEDYSYINYLKSIEFDIVAGTTK